MYTKITVKFEKRSIKITTYDHFLIHKMLYETFDTLFVPKNCLQTQINHTSSESKITGINGSNKNGFVSFFYSM